MNDVESFEELTYCKHDIMYCLDVFFPINDYKIYILERSSSPKNIFIRSSFI